MAGYAATSLWKKSLSAHAGDSAEIKQARSRLRNAYERFREHAALLAAEIPQNLKEFTVHDVTHLDALWEVASIAAGPEYPLNPIEGFVLGGAFLIHDLGMALAAYPKGLDELKRDPIWTDTVRATLKRKLGRMPTAQEASEPDEVTQKSATAEALRVLHARQAEKLATLEFKHENQSHFLIEDVDLRYCFGPLIGRLAHSHWWSVSQVASQFNTTIGAAHWAPADWTVDPLKLACLLRIADAAHLDARRAPGFLRAVRRPGNAADLHWGFQQNLHKPQVVADRLIFTSGHAFTKKEAGAWWLCLENLRMVDRELQHVHALLTDLHKPTLQATGVAGIDDPVRLTRYVQTDGWIPVDARIRVGNVPELVRRLGGEELYGDDETVPLRELVQNGCDAVRARRFLENRSDSWGSVTVRLYEKQSIWWLEVQDNGLGMSADVLTGPFLDFGTSYWGSSLMIQELPGLLSHGFESTGKYGIGFFSVFMLGDRVQVITRRFDEAPHSTRVLEFEAGLEERPLLRAAERDEFLIDGGTTVRVQLISPPNEQGALLWNYFERNVMSLVALVAWLCPAVDVDLCVSETEAEEATRVVEAGDWLKLDTRSFLRRTSKWYVSKEQYLEDFSPIAEHLLTEVSEDGRVVGRIAILPSYGTGTELFHWSRFSGVVTVGGLRSVDLHALCGLMVGNPQRAARDMALPLIKAETLASWATEQAQKCTAVVKTEYGLAEVACVVHRCGGLTGALPVVFTASGWMNIAQIAQYAKKQKSILVGDFEEVARFCADLSDLELGQDVVLVPYGPAFLLQSRISSDFDRWPEDNYDNLGGRFWNYERRSIRGLLLQLLMENWVCSKPDILANVTLSDNVTRINLGKYKGRDLLLVGADLICRPDKG